MSLSRRPSPVDALTGIVTALFDIEMEKSDPDVHVFATQTTNIRAYGYPYDMASAGSGAGLTREAAVGAAVGESLERYACSVSHPEDLILASAGALEARGEHIVSPSRWALFDPAAAALSEYARFDADVRIAWTPAQSLTHQVDSWVPASLVYMPLPKHFAEQGEQFVASAISTGAACAPTPAEAMFKGICEVLERDAFIISWRNRLPLPRVEIDPASALYELFQRRFARPGLEYTIFCTTLDLEMPSFLGIMRDLRRVPPSLTVGGAAHPDPSRAVLKTLLELVQGLKWSDNVTEREFPIVESFSNVRGFDDRMKLYAFNDLFEAFGFLDHKNAIPLSAIASSDSQNASQNLRNWLSRLKAHGLEALAVDLTTVDLEACGYAVTKVVIPECEVMEGDHTKPFLGGRRWREAPQRLGLKAAPMNPYPHPYP